MGKNVSLVLFGLPVLPVMKGRACMTDSLLDELLKHLVCNCVCAASIQPCIIYVFADHTNHSVCNYMFMCGCASIHVRGCLQTV